MNENGKRSDVLQKVDVPKYIKYFSVIYIAVSVVSRLLNLILAVLDDGRATAEQLTGITLLLKDLVTGLLFWGTGQVFSKFMEKNK
ncbi:MAG: hypothetical protein ACTTKL_06365 [Treponema sp.]